MRKSILMTGLTVIVALFCTTCYDSGTDSGSDRWAGDVDNFLRWLDGAPPIPPPPVTPPGATYTLSTSVSPIGSGSVYISPQKDAYGDGEAVTVTAEAVNSEYAFAGWEGASDAITGSVTVIMNGDKTLTANFTRKQANTYTLTVNAEPPAGGTVTSSPAKTVYTANEDVTVTATPYSHYTFIGWSGASSSTNEALPLVMNSDKNLTANFTINKYKLTTEVSVEGGGTVTRTPERDIYTAGDTVTVTAEAAQNYTFKGWSGSSSSTSAEIKIVMDGTKSLTADFGRNGADISRFTLYFDGNGAAGNAPEAKTTDSGHAITLPDPMVKSGHQFGGWNTNNTGTGDNYAAGSSYTVTQNNVTLYARWLPVRTITFNPSGGTVNPTSGTTDTTGILTTPPPTPTRTGHKFGGWFNAETGGISITTTHTFNDDATIYARWTIITYDVTWNVDGGAPPPIQTTVNHDGSITEPAAMTRTGYTFGGWYTNSTFTTPASFPISNVTENKTLYAKWTADPTTVTYTVTWNAGGGSPVPTLTSVSQGGSIAAPSAMTKTGYSFGGWYSNEAMTGTAVTFPITNVTGPITLYAKWTQSSTGSDLCASCVSAAFGAPAPSVLLHDFSTSRNALGEYAYSYKSDPSQLEEGSDGRQGDGKSIHFTLAGQYPYAGIGTNLGDDRTPLNASAFTGIYLEYKTTGIEYVTVLVIDMAHIMNPEAGLFINLPGTNGVWMSAVIPFVRLVPPSWVTPTPTLNINNLTKINIEYNKLGTGTIAVDNIYFLGDNKFPGQSPP